MSTIRLIQIYQSPWSERARWGFAFKEVPYEKEDYQIDVGEERLKKQTGQAQVPVLLVNGTVIPDSTAMLNWLEDHKPDPPLLPTTDKERAEVMLWEELTDWVLGCPCRIDFSRADALLMAASGRATSMSFLFTSRYAFGLSNSGK